jgi:hypothetical protein
MLSNDMTRSLGVVLSAGSSSLSSVGAFWLPGSLNFVGTLSLLGSFKLHGAFQIHGSLGASGTLRLSGSLSFHGTVGSDGSLRYSWCFHRAWITRLH